MVNLLLSCPSIDLYHKDESGNSLADYAQQSNFTYALFDPTNVAKKRKEGHTCCSLRVNYGLLIASGKDDSFMVKSFLQCRHVDLNEGNEYDETPLYLAQLI